MKAAEIAKAAQQALLSGEFDYVRVNFANGDMVGHTGDLEATKLACESVDQGVKVSSFVTPTHLMALKSLDTVALVALSRASIL
jgi:bisphosphoglycerate-independent phosphoglycerate mutase (AlkP superfamily)